MYNPIFLIVSLIGIALLVKPVIISLVSLKNNFRGIKTDITPYTIWYYRIIGIVFIIAGIVLAFTQAK